MEQVRQRLMSETVEWGSTPPNHPSPLSELVHAPVNIISRGELLATALPDAPTASQKSASPDMEYVLEHQGPPKTTISSKDWTVDGLVERGKRFEKVARVSIHASSAEVAAAIEYHELAGTPLIIEGLHKHKSWPKEMFEIDWFREHGEKDAKARNVHDWIDRDISLDELIDKQRAIGSYITPEVTSSPKNKILRGLLQLSNRSFWADGWMLVTETERLYGKDAHCPNAWSKWLNEAGVIPSSLIPEASNNLLQVLPEAERVETLMCYLGIGDTFTPCHKDLCASSGQNVMCYTENNGSSFWFMTSGAAAPDVADYFHGLGQELDLETHVITVEELVNAPFKVYIAEQKLGDMVLVPPRSCHQVVNHGGITIKTSWSRMTLDGLRTAFYHELAIYRRVCRTETYRVKYTIYHALLRCTRSLNECMPPPTPKRGMQLSDSSRHGPSPLTNTELKTEINLAKELKSLIDLFDDVLMEEYCHDHKAMPRMIVSTISDESDESNSSVAPAHHDTLTRVTCDFCDTDVFQSFFECLKCIPGLSEVSNERRGEPAHGDGLIVCSSCYVEGRSCRCEAMQPMQCRSFSELLRDRNDALMVLQRSNAGDGVSGCCELLDERDLSGSRELGLFRAACAVNAYHKNQTSRRRLVNKTTLKCRLAGAGKKNMESHPVHYTAQLRCEGCHAGMCFECALQLGIHSAEAITVHQLDASHHLWHERHKDTKAFTGALPQVLQAEKDGIRCNLRHKLVVTARKFSTCMPSNSEFTKPGWYDKFIQTSSIPTQDSEKQAIEQPIERVDDEDYLSDLYSIRDPSPLSALSSLPPSPVTLGVSLSDYEPSESTTSTVERAPLTLGTGVHLSVRPTIMGTPSSMSFTVDGPSSTHRKRKRQVIDCILIPPHSMSVLPSKSTVRRGKFRESGMAMEKGGGDKDRTFSLEDNASTYSQQSTQNTHTYNASGHPIKESPRRPRVRRIISSSRESSPIGSVEKVKSSSNAVDEDEPPNKKVRLRKGPPGVRVGHVAVPSSSVPRKRKAEVRDPAAVDDEGFSRASALLTSGVSMRPSNITMRRVEHTYSAEASQRPPFVMDATEDGPEWPARRNNRNIADKNTRLPGIRTSSKLATAHASNANTSQIATNLSRHKYRSMEKEIEDLRELFERQHRENHRMMRILQEEIKTLKTQNCASSRQEDLNANHRLKVQQDIKYIREEAAQHAARTDKRFSDINTDLTELRSRVTEKIQSTVSPSTSTHLVLQTDSLSILSSLEKSNSGRKTRGKQSVPSTRGRQHHVPPRLLTMEPSLEGSKSNRDQDFIPGPHWTSQVGRQINERNHDEGWPHARPQSVEFHQQRHSFHGNNAGSFPTQEHPQRNQGMNRQPSLSASSPRAAPRGPVQNKMKRREPIKQSHSPRANSYKGPPLVARQAIEIQGLNSKQVSESPAPFSYITTEVSANHPEPSPSSHWEDGYEEVDETAEATPLHSMLHIPSYASTSGRNFQAPVGESIVDGNEVESNPWAEAAVLKQKTD